MVNNMIKIFDTHSMFQPDKKIFSIPEKIQQARLRLEFVEPSKIEIKINDVIWLPRNSERLLITKIEFVLLNLFPGDIWEVWSDEALKEIYFDNHPRYNRYSIGFKYEN